MYWDVLEVKYIAGRELAVRFDGGLAGILYIDRSFCTGVFEPLQNDELVGHAIVNNGVLMWPNGLDLAPDTMFHEIKRNPNKRYKLSRK